MNAPEDNPADDEPIDQAAYEQWMIDQGLPADPECSTCGDGGEVAGDPVSDDGCGPCPDCKPYEIEVDW